MLLIVRSFVRLLLIARGTSGVGRVSVCHTVWIHAKMVTIIVRIVVHTLAHIRRREKQRLLQPVALFHLPTPTASPSAHQHWRPHKYEKMWNKTYEIIQLLLILENI